MMKHRSQLKTHLLQLAALGMVALVAGCGGGGGGSEPPVAAIPTITGLAATGAALANATVAARCTAGLPLSGKTGADGTFSIELAGGQTVPCMVQVSNGTVTLHSFAVDVGRINVTPLTDLAIGKALGSDAAAAFSSFDAGKGAAIRAGLEAAKTYVKSEMTAMVGGGPSVDMFTGVFRIGDADDKLLDSLNGAVVAAGKKLDDLRMSAVGGMPMAAALARGSLVDPAAVVATLTVAQIDGGTAASGLQPLSGKAKCDVKVVALNYSTVGVAGEKANASGVMLVPAPTGANCIAPAALVAYAKGTDVQKPRTLANPADSETFLLIAMYAAQGYAVVATDYLGFAKSTYAYHPYLHANSEASSVIDSIRAARKAAAATAVGASLSGKVMLSGYSQGGHSSMAAQRAIERDHAGEINVVAGAHLAGPYNLSGSIKSSAVVAGYQFFVPFLVTSWQKIYGNIYSDVKAVFKPPYADDVEGLLPNSTLTYTTLVTTGKVPGAGGESPSQARDAMFQPAFIVDTQTNDQSPLYLAAKKNDLLGWSPKAKVLLCGGAGDPTVSPAIHQNVMKADFDSRALSNITSVDVDPLVQATYGAVLTSNPAAYYASYHGSYEPPFCAAQAKATFDSVN